MEEYTITILVNRAGGFPGYNMSFIPGYRPTAWRSLNTIIAERIPDILTAESIAIGVHPTRKELSVLGFECHTLFTPAEFFCGKQSTTESPVHGFLENGVEYDRSYAFMTDKELRNEATKLGLSLEHYEERWQVMELLRKHPK